MFGHARAALDGHHFLQFCERDGGKFAPTCKIRPINMFYEACCALSGGDAELIAYFVSGRIKMACKLARAGQAANFWYARFLAKFVVSIVYNATLSPWRDCVEVEQVLESWVRSQCWLRQPY